MPPIFAFYFRQVAIGYVWAVLFVAALLYFNVANLWQLISASDIGVLAVFLLVMFNGIVFSGVQFGVAIWNMARDEDDEPGTGAGVAAEPLPVAVRRI